MTLSDAANIGQLVGALAVVGSLIFVGLQVRQNTRSNQASTLQLNADYWLSYLATVADPGFSKVYAMGASGKLDQQQFGQFFLLCRATFMGCENQHYQYRLGLLDKDAYAGYQTTIREQIAAFPGIRAMWQLVRHSYSTTFAAFMDEQISAMPQTHESDSAFQRWQGLVQTQSRTVNAPEQH
jgi:hypothetical protein